MPIEIRELIIKATLNNPKDFMGEPAQVAGRESYPDAYTVEQNPRWRELVAAQLERLLPGQLERFLARDPRYGFSEQTLTEHIVQVLARMKER